MWKLHLPMRANTLVIFPVSFGRAGALFETLTLQQTRKRPPIPRVLFA